MSSFETENTLREAQIDRAERAAAFDASIQSSELVEQLATPDERVAFVKGLDGDTFIGLLEGFQAILLDNAEGESPYREKELGCTLEESFPIVVNDVMPANEDKHKLMKMVLAAAQKLDDPADQAVVLGYGISNVHPFTDGNGRISRTIYSLIHDGPTDGRERLMQALGPDGDNVMMLNGSIFNHGVYNFLYQAIGSHRRTPFGTLEPQIHVTNKYEDFMNVVPVPTTNREYDHVDSTNLKLMFGCDFTASAVAYLLRTRADLPAFNEAFHRTKSDELVFLYDDFVVNATDSDVRRAYNMLRLVKRKYIEILMQSFLREPPCQNQLLAVRSAPTEPMHYLNFGKKAAENQIDLA